MDVVPAPYGPEEQDAARRRRRSRKRKFLLLAHMIMTTTLTAMLATGLNATPEPWYNDPNRPRTLQAVLGLLGVHVEHFTRFTADQINHLVVRTGVAFIEFNVRGAGVCEGGLAFVMMLTRLAHPFYGRTLEFMFGADRTRITRWTNACLIWFFDEFNHLLQLNIQRFVERAPEYAAAVARKMGAVHGGRNILFVDGIFVPICKPRVEQKSYYSGYYKGHGLKFQGCVSVTGLFEDFFGPEVGKEHDLTLWADSGLPDYLRFIRECRAEDYGDDGRWFAVGDPAYRCDGCEDDIVCAFDRLLHLSPAQLRFNAGVTRVRVTVEWAFGHLYNLWESLRFLPLKKIGCTPVAKHVMVCAILTNMRTCLRGRNQISTYFDASPPTLDEYLEAPKPIVSRVESHLEELDAALNDVF